MTCPGGLEVVAEAERVTFLAGRVRWVLEVDGEVGADEVARITARLLAIYEGRALPMGPWSK